jgi:hypothetical protein
MNSIDPADIISHPIAPGIIGSLVALKFVPGNNWLERACNLVTSFSIVIYGSPAVNSYFDITAESMKSCMCFAIGLFGLSLAKAIFTGISETKLGAIFSSIITSWFSRKG